MQSYNCITASVQCGFTLAIIHADSMEDAAKTALAVIPIHQPSRRNDAFADVTPLGDSGLQLPDWTVYRNVRPYDDDENVTIYVTEQGPTSERLAVVFASIVATFCF